MSRAVLDSATTEPEPNEPPTTIRTIVWAAGIGITGVLALVVMLAANLVFGGSPGARHADATPSAAGASTAAGPPDPRHLSLSSPDTIGGLRKRSSQSFPDLAGRAAAEGLTQTLTATYADPKDLFVAATVWGGSGRRGGAQDTIEDFRDATAVLVPTASLGASAPADPGPIGGLAECTPLDGLDTPATICAWTGADAVVAVLAAGYDLAAATKLLPTLLTAMVKVS
jgi:hypothetical protein